MCGRILLWALLLGFAGGWGGVVTAAEVRPGSAQALAVGLVGGSVLGAALGAGGVVLLGRRHPGD